MSRFSRYTGHGVLCTDTAPCPSAASSGYPRSPAQSHSGAPRVSSLSPGDSASCTSFESAANRLHMRGCSCVGGAGWGNSGGCGGWAADGGGPQEVRALAKSTRPVIIPSYEQPSLYPCSSPPLSLPAPGLAREGRVETACWTWWLLLPFIHSRRLWGWRRGITTKFTAADDHSPASPRPPPLPPPPPRPLSTFRTIPPAAIAKPRVSSRTIILPGWRPDSTPT